MAQIKLKIPASLYANLEKMANFNNRSINEEIIACLEQSTGQCRPDSAYFIRQAGKIHNLAKGSLTEEEIEAAINEGRP